jgi:uncharacterized membrane protein
MKNSKFQKKLIQNKFRKFFKLSVNIFFRNAGYFDKKKEPIIFPLVEQTF